MPNKDHKPYAGRRMADAEPLPSVKCAFCDRKFLTVTAATMHEQAYHKKLLKQTKRNQVDE